MRITVYHREYGCESGCCGHYVKLDDVENNIQKSLFCFDHPGTLDKSSNHLKFLPETDIEFAKRLIEENFHPEHVKDLDWDHCIYDIDTGDC